MVVHQDYILLLVSFCMGRIGSEKLNVEHTEIRHSWELVNKVLRFTTIMKVSGVVCEIIVCYQTINNR